MDQTFGQTQQLTFYGKSPIEVPTKTKPKRDESKPRARTVTKKDFRMYSAQPRKQVIIKSLTNAHLALKVKPAESHLKRTASAVQM